MKVEKCSTVHEFTLCFPFLYQIVPLDEEEIFRIVNHFVHFSFERQNYKNSVVISSTL